MPIFGKRNKSGNGYSDTDSEAWGVAKSNEIVRTVQPVRGYRNVTVGEIQKMKDQVKQRLEASKRFDQWLQLHAQWEAIDATDTKALLAYKAQLAKVLTDKQAAIAARDVAVENLRIPQAKMQQGITDARANADRAIAEMRARQQEIAQKNGWGRDKR